MNDEYYVELLQQQGLFKYLKQGKYLNHDDALTTLKQQPSGTYILKTFWDGKLFGTDRIVKREGHLCWKGMLIYSFHDIVNLSLDIAKLSNRFHTHEEKQAARRRLASAKEAKHDTNNLHILG